MKYKLVIVAGRVLGIGGLLLGSWLRVSPGTDVEAVVTSENTSEVLSIIDALAERFDATTEALWKSYVSYVQLCSILDSVGTMILMFGVLWIAIISIKACEDQKIESALVIRIILVIVISVTLAVPVGINLATVLEPNGAAVEKIINGRGP